MRTLERYIFRQVLLPVGGAVAALTGIGLLSQSLGQFDLIVEHGQSAWTFLEVTLLSMPQLGGLLFPLALFVGTLIALTRLSNEHEFTAAYASGVPLMRIASPIVRIGVYFALISLASNLFLQPIASRTMRQMLFDIKNDLISTMVKENDFSTSKTGMTIYVQAIYQKHHADGFEVIGVSLDDDQEALDAFIKKKQVPWPQLFDGKGWESELAQQFGIKAIPAPFLIGRDGNLIAADLRGDDLADAVTKALAEGKAAAPAP